MYFKQFLNEDCGCSSYLVASRQSREAIVVDPALDLEPYKEVLRERGFKLRYVLDTHVHADHVSGARQFAAETGAEIVMHESAPLRFPFRGVRDGEVLELGQLRLTILHTPGHRPESISVLVTNPPRGEEPSMVLTGDTLLVGDVGRPDFGGADGAAQEWESLRRLLQLDDYVEVFPAHFEGSCGKGMCGRPSTTIGFERRHNPLLQQPSRDAFVSAAMAEIPAKPLNMAAIVATNLGEADLSWAMLRDPQPVEELDAAQARQWLDSDRPFVVDVREPAEYAAGHIPGALSIPQSQLASRLAELPQDRPLLVVCAAGSRSLRAAQFLRQAGYGRAVSLRGGTGGWRQAGYPIETEPALADSRA